MLVMEDIGIFIKNSKGKVAQIPVNPSELKISGDGNNQSMEIVSLGEISILKKRKLQTVEWESWFPFDTWHPSVRTGGEFKSPEWYVKFIENIRKSCKPCQLIITGLNINMEVSIEDFSFYHQGGDHEDKYYSITLKEYTPYEVTIVPATAADLKRWGTVLGSTSSGSKAQTASKITIGSVCIVNGIVYNDSNGTKSSRTLYSYVAKCSNIMKGAKYPYFMVSQTNRWLGWANKKAVRLA